MRWLGVEHFVIVNVCHINPSLNGQPQFSVFQNHCVAVDYSIDVVGFIQTVTHFNQKALDKGMGSCHDISTFNKGKTFYQGEKEEKSNCFQ